MTPRGAGAPGWARFLFRLVMLLYPGRLRDRFGLEMWGFFQDDYRAEVTAGRQGAGRFVAWSLWRLAANGLGARFEASRSGKTRGHTAEPPRSTRPPRRGAADVLADAGLALRHTLRSLRRSPGFTATAVLTLGLGLGACTTIFAVTYPVLLAPLDYPDAQRLVSVYETSPPPEARRGWVSPVTFRDWRERAEQFEALAGWRLSIMTWTGTGEPRVVRGWAVSAGFFDLLGVDMRLGRSFTEEEDGPGGAQVVVLSHATWVQDFGSDPGVVGQTLSLDGLPYTVVGVADPAVEAPGEGDFFMPMGLDYAAEFRDFRYLGVLGRLREGATLEGANAELGRISAQLASENPETNTGWGATATSLKEDRVGHVRPVLMGMSGAVALLLLIALGNVGNLSMGRGAGRRTERAVRRALGASRGDLVRARLGEAMVLSLAGGLLGWGLAAAGIRWLGGAALGRLPRADAIQLGPGAALFALAVALSVGLCLGLFSLLGARGGTLGEEIRAGSGGGTPSRRTHRVREVVLATQVALALSLLIGASLLARSLVALGRVDVGFEPDGVLAFSYDLPRGSYGDPDAIRGFYRDVLPAIRALPGVEAAGAVTPMPMELGSTPGPWRLADADPSDPPVTAHMRTVSPGYFSAMGIPVIQGRPFDSQDVEASAPVVLVSAAFVERYLGGGNPIGSRVAAGTPGDEEVEWMTVVGVVGDVRFRSLRTPPEPEIYLTNEQLPTGWGHLVVRTGLGEQEVARAVAAAVHGVDPELPVDEVLTGERIIGRQLATTWLSVTLSSVFAAAAGALALVGMVGVLSIALAQRLREIGVRLLLGAPPATIRRYAVGRVARPVGIGLALGVLLSVAASRLLERQVFEVSAVDPMTFVLVTAVFAAVGLAVCLAPALRASATDPVTLLRSE